MAYRRRMLEDIGFLDPDFVMIYEDADLSFRAQLRGYECVYVPGAIVYHRYRVTIGKAPCAASFLLAAEHRVRVPEEHASGPDPAIGYRSACCTKSGRLFISASKAPVLRSFGQSSMF